MDKNMKKGVKYAENVLNFVEKYEQSKKELYDIENIDDSWITKNNEYVKQIDTDGIDFFSINQQL